MARSKGLLRSIAMREDSAPDRIFSEVNRELLESNETRMFITVFLGILDVQSGDLIFSNAGHVPPLLITAAGSCETVALPPGKPLGISRKSVYVSRHLKLNVNDRLLVFTDGISEAMDTRGEFYGEERLVTALQGHQDLVTAKDVVEAVLREVRAFSENAPQFDDIAGVCLRRTTERH
jgi:serine phosphatase RsbU (regulator of sigma subunit)